ncbi:class I SAM-dependent methyltransferase [Bradyrhizobium sp. 1(2017)]|uniref:class I SAM-dependent methyltransferase n=1 Tax=Bradyrhizobium sp. 1(2017) TaxID=1404888 RepID=UPI00140EAF9C|nr:class I SAM-dependent methyltransferase [Bradyrhizobium sp. 1(2017)]QIO32749.1 class I SAM-dependent methyltransferase [Bradyrhizobium sp. 1(2017)]
MTFGRDLKPASRLELSRAYAVDIARSLRRITFKNIRRTRDVVDAEYNAGEWGRILSERAWLREHSLEDFLVGHNEAPRLAKVDGRIVRISTKDYYRYRLGALSELIVRHAGEATSLIELGAGFGYNLFSLCIDPRWTRLRGLDIAPNGIEAGRQIAGHFGFDDRISVGRIDLTDPADPSFRELTGATILTYFCIEQIPHAVDAVVDHILKMRPARVINIEPAVDMLDLSDPRDIASRIYIRSMDYQTRLWTLLDELDHKGRIRVKARERMNFAPTLHNDGMLYAWEPLGASD